MEGAAAGVPDQTAAVAAPGPYTPGRRPAGVLVPVYDGPRGATLLLIRRTAGGLHGGQVAFPGGRPEPGDATLLGTALREAYEEVGIEPAAVEVVGVLPVVETLTSNFAIFAYVGRLPERPRLRLQASEVAAVLDVPLADLLAPGLPVEEVWEFSRGRDQALAPAAGGRRTAGARPEGAAGESGAVRRPVRYFPWGEDKIWGATARIVEHLLAALRTGTLRLSGS